MNTAKLPTSLSLSAEILERNLAMNWLIDHFPKAFDLRNRRPLKEEIMQDIIDKSIENTPSKEALAAALNYYTHWGSYLTGLTVGKRRIDLDGVAVSFVSAKCEAIAKDKLQKEQIKCVKNL